MNITQTQRFYRRIRQLACISAVASSLAASPLTEEPVTQVSEPGEHTWYGHQVAGAGDVNNDGFDDIIVGAPRSSIRFQLDGCAYVYMGSPAGILPQHRWAVNGSRSGQQLGYSVSGAGDVNGDGFSDVIISALSSPLFAAVYMGSAAGVTTESVVVLPEMSGSRVFQVAGAGDLNADGFADVAVVIVDDDAGVTRVTYYTGSISGPVKAENWSAIGNWASAAGDVNGDGFDDLVVGNPSSDREDDTQAGEAYVYLGSAVGLSAVPAWTAKGVPDEHSFGASASSAGDINADGYDDLIVGKALDYHTTTFTPNDDVGANLYLGSATGLSLIPIWTAAISPEDSYFGSKVAAAGDVNGDGFSDVIIGAFHYPAGERNGGKAYLYTGSENDFTQSSWIVRQATSNEVMGRSVAGAGDVNGDGLDDVVINRGAQFGRAEIYHGVARTAAVIDWQLFY